MLATSLTLNGLRRRSVRRLFHRWGPQPPSPSWLPATRRPQSLQGDRHGAVFAGAARATMTAVPAHHCHKDDRAACAPGALMPATVLATFSTGSLSRGTLFTGELRRRGELSRTRWPPPGTHLPTHGGSTRRCSGHGVCSSQAASVMVGVASRSARSRHRRTGPHRRQKLLGCVTAAQLASRSERGLDASLPGRRRWRT